MPLSPNTRKTLIIAGVLLFIIVSIREFAARSDSTMVFLGISVPPLISDASIARNLNTTDPNLLIDSIGLLAHRDNPAATAKARELMTGNTLWIHGALYLGHFQDPSAIPYLIKGLHRNAASKLHPLIAQELENVTGQHYGQNFQNWRDWWQQSHPDSHFDFESNLEAR
jgi:hypothetical protein